MSMSAGGNNRGLENEPNVTPMIDVLLVLLITFMVMLPTMRKAIDVQLPDPNPSVQPANAKNDQIVLSVNADGTFLINTEPQTKATLAARLKAIYTDRPEKVIFVKGDPNVKYSAIIDAMDIVRGAGVLVIGVPPKDMGK